ncbi:hypothetical protein F5Y12DRAFT_793961 [Xylaria sp. FL1777]|nr:hypothetical protein F5Y12DRAFT_793961 [Xylaria sp. FL1777]
MIKYSLALVAFAVALSLYVQWADKLSFFLWTAMFIVSVAYNAHANPLIIALVLFTTFLVLLLALIVSSRLFVIAVLLPSLLAAYTGKLALPFCLGLLVYQVWMSGPLGVLSFFSHLLLIALLKTICSPPPNQVETWSSIVQILDLNLDPITSCIHAYQVHIHPAIFLLSQSLFQFVDKVIYIVEQSVKTVVWTFTERYDYCPDWKTAEFDRQEAESRARKLREKIPPEVARRQREEADLRWRQHQRKVELQGRNADQSRQRVYQHRSRPLLNRFVANVIDVPPSKPFSPEFLRMISGTTSNSPSGQHEPNQLGSQLFESPVPTFPAPFHQPLISPHVSIESPVPTLPTPFRQPFDSPQVSIESPVVPIPRSSGQCLPWVPSTNVQKIPEAQTNRDFSHVSNPVPFVEKPAPFRGIGGKRVTFCMEHQIIEPAQNQRDEAMEDVMDEAMEELNSLLKGLEIKSEPDDELMDVDSRRPALSWIVGEAPFAPLYFRAPHTSVSSPAPYVHADDLLSFAEFSAALAVATIDIPQISASLPVTESAPPTISVTPAVPEPVPQTMFRAPIEPAAPVLPLPAAPIPQLSAPLLPAPPATLTTPIVPAASAVTFSRPAIPGLFTEPSAPAPAPAPAVPMVPTISPTTPFTFSAPSLPPPPPTQPPVVFTGPATPMSSAFTFSLPSSLTLAPPPPTSPPSQDAPKRIRIKFTGYVPPAPELTDDDELERQLIEEYNALPSKSEKQSTLEPEPREKEEETPVYEGLDPQTELDLFGEDPRKQSTSEGKPAEGGPSEGVSSALLDPRLFGVSLSSAQPSSSLFPELDEAEMDQYLGLYDQPAPAPPVPQKRRSLWSRLKNPDQEEIDEDLLFGACRQCQAPCGRQSSGFKASRLSVHLPSQRPLATAWVLTPLLSSPLDIHPCFSPNNPVLDLSINLSETTLLGIRLLVQTYPPSSSSSRSSFDSVPA